MGVVKEPVWQPFALKSHGQAKAHKAQGLLPPLLMAPGLDLFLQRRAALTSRGGADSPNYVPVLWRSLVWRHDKCWSALPDLDSLLEVKCLQMEYCPYCWRSWSQTLALRCWMWS